MSGNSPDVFLSRPGGRAGQVYVYARGEGDRVYALVGADGERVRTRVV